MSKRHGHFCWCCGRMRPNERFSGAGHARHLCKDCHKLGGEELTYQRAFPQHRPDDPVGDGPREAEAVDQLRDVHAASKRAHPPVPEGVAAGGDASDVDEDLAGGQAFELVWKEEEGRGPGETG